MIGEGFGWRHPWSSDIITYLISSTNREGTITNFDLELATLILREATLIAAVPNAKLAAPHSGSDNAPTLSLIMKKALTINRWLRTFFTSVRSI